MVWIKNVGMKPAHICDVCGHGYRDVWIALECESCCRGRNHPSPGIAKKAVYSP